MQKSNLRVLCLKNQFISKWKNGTKHFFKLGIGDGTLFLGFFSMEDGDDVE